MKYKITTKDQQWTMKDGLSFEELCKFWDNNGERMYGGHVVDYRAFDENGEEVVLGNDGTWFLEKI